MSAAPALSPLRVETRSLVRPSAPATLARELDRAWDRQRLVQVDDQQLGRALDAVHARNVRSGLFEDRHEGITRVPGAGSGQDFDLMLVPNRGKPPVARDNTGSDGCAMCSPPEPKERGLRWRDYKIWPNAYPYFPESSQHVLVTTDEHRGQGFEPKMVGDLLDLQNLYRGAVPYSLFFNGRASNSQFHLHWQAARELFPIQRALESGQVPCQALVRAKGGTVETFEGPFYAGFLVTGDKSFLMRWGERITQALEADPITRGMYNLALLQPVSGQGRLVVVPRRADCLRPEIPSYGKPNMGGLSFSGVVVVPRAEAPAALGEDLIAAASQTVVRPSELDFVRALRGSKGRTVVPVFSTAKVIELGAG